MYPYKNISGVGTVGGDEVLQLIVTLICQYGPAAVCTG